MKVLLISDYECPFLWDYCQPAKLKEYDLILSCGDLKASYLTFLVTMARCPLLYVHGNHDGSYADKPPEGCECIDNRLVTVNGLRILGLGGSPFYNGGPHQYTERQMDRRVRKLWWTLRRAGGVDIVVTHAPPAGWGDGDDYAHRGFETLLPLLDKYKPRYLVHGHVHPNYGTGHPRTLRREDTTIINAWERFELEL